MGTRHLYWILTGPYFVVWVVQLQQVNNMQCAGDQRVVIKEEPSDCNFSLQYIAKVLP